MSNHLAFLFHHYPMSFFALFFAGTWLVLLLLKQPGGKGR